MKSPERIQVVRRRGIPAFSVLLIMAALTVIGVAMLPMLNIQYTPTVAERKIDVSFNWPEASARLIEQHVTSRIEGAMSVVAGCESVSSRSSKGKGSVTVRFRKGTDMAAARFEVASAIRNLYSKLPEEVSYPAISVATSGSKESETLVYTIKADLPSERIEEYVSSHVSIPLSQLDGVVFARIRPAPRPLHVRRPAGVDIPCERRQARPCIHIERHRALPRSRAGIPTCR